MKEENRPQIDPYLFEMQFKAFCKFVEEKSGIPFSSFPSNPYTEKHEGYKYEIYKQAREALVFQAWQETDIGSGDIIASTIQAIEIPSNNLVPWKTKYGEESRPHQPLYKAYEDEVKENIYTIEKSLFKLYHSADDSETFSELISIFGKKYSLIAYLFFIKDRSKYLPIAPTYFDISFELLGAKFKTARRCSWENYYTFLGLVKELKNMLSESLSSEVSLLDAHSFAWVLSAHMQEEGKLAIVKEYLKLSDTEREAIIKSRIGQGYFRDNLVKYWKKCSVTGCSKISILRASHIKPWAKSTVNERLSCFNGLLLCPNLDVCFDKGYITFDNDGKILISSKLNQKDLNVLGINVHMKLLKNDPKHQQYLSYHRKHIFIP